MDNIKIEKRLIDEAIRIREEYLKSLVILKDNEKLIISIKNDLNESYELSKNSVNDIDKEMIESKISTLTKNIKNLQKNVDPITEKINLLRNESDTLYENIKDKYPDISKEDLVNVLQPYMKKIDDKFNLF